MIDNPEYKGVWKARQIDNPSYKGAWVHPEIDNPEYEEDPNIYLFKDLGAIGFDLWQVKSGTIFDNVIITDSVQRAEDFGNETWGKTKDAEKKMKDKLDEDERKKREAGKEFSKFYLFIYLFFFLEDKSKPPTDNDDDTDTEDDKPTHVHDDEL
jgi:calreticulin